jgi:hypothetical protein
MRLQALRRQLAAPIARRHGTSPYAAAGAPGVAHPGRAFRVPDMAFGPDAAGLEQVIAGVTQVITVPHHYCDRLG